MEKINYVEMADVFLSDPCEHNWAKDILRQGLMKDCVDAVQDLEEVLKILKARMNYYLHLD